MDRMIMRGMDEFCHVPDGSWDYDTPQERAERIGSLDGMIHCLRWLHEFRLSEAPWTMRTLDFHPGCGWSI